MNDTPEKIRERLQRRIVELTPDGVGMIDFPPALRAMVSAVAEEIARARGDSPRPHALGETQVETNLRRVYMLGCPPETPGIPHATYELDEVIRHLEAEAKHTRAFAFMEGLAAAMDAMRGECNGCVVGTPADPNACMYEQPNAPEGMRCYLKPIRDRLASLSEETKP